MMIALNSDMDIKNRGGKIRGSVLTCETPNDTIQKLKKFKVMIQRLPQECMNEIHLLMQNIKKNDDKKND